MYIYNNFPDPKFAPDDMPLCVGGNLNPETLINAYKKGIFPWFLENEPILWWSPNPRAVLSPKEIRVQKSMKPFLNRYSVKFDYDFESLINLCFNQRQKEGATWLSQDIVNAYTKLYHMGIAHSVEVYNKSNKLIGGLYGLIFGKLFCGESMISIEKNASKTALIYLCKTLEKYNFLIDCQISNPHLKFMGSRNISRDKFLEISKILISQEVIDFKKLKPIYN
ncbi:leucyl, phenylalanyl-tRNA-protein transferase [Campylobacter blaseri]|uniref:Leucyl/phenylalanyl-tRNA--protein transferase n=1 Tax=Campylobacter blaseri TaxID=2042961 RepID=A0A2P8R062_9BACT|nr:leucyl/phenylalanyl-tRNA--protein transferase [Campylobacter blaseri]PSM51883.1 leucyl/phenylalanyl-tRNA--protein transferase [Campylobacter blaseri]PSM53667.1 leucyl/phenylalanyl-tRNA--protein transferase [Campylobacter blaseri]QKF85780.1 leucyl, phenylalanyl-tRNA-protein transferase [Campylobacter blaseri]